MGSAIKQGDVLEVSFDPVRGREQSGVRPAIVVSGNALNDGGLLFIFPLTTKIKKYICDPIISPTKENGLKKESEILVGQIRTISHERVIRKIGKIEQTLLHKLLESFDFLCDR